MAGATPLVAPVFLRVLALALVLVAAGGTGCVKRGTAVETQPVTTNLSAYWTCAVAFASDAHGADANEAFTFVPWFEGRVRERGVFEPLGRDEGAEAEVTLRLEASEANDRVSLRAEVIDTRTKASLGELEATGIVDVGGDAGDPSEPPRLVALRSAAEQILDVLKDKRRISTSQAKRASASESSSSRSSASSSSAASSPLPGAAPLPDAPPVAGSATCSTQCAPPASSSSSHDEQYRVAAGMNDTMKELRGCLDRVGAQLVDPAVLLRFAPDGQLRHMRVDVGGYEQLDCIRQIRARIPRSVSTSRASLLRCEYRCTVS